MPGQQMGPRKTYLSIVQGSLRQKVDSNTTGAIARKYKSKDKNGSEIEAIKHELIYLDWAGILEDMRFKDGDYGQVLELVFEDAILTIPTESQYFQDFAQRIMNADLKQEVIVHPFDFEDEKGVSRKGISVTQNGKKLKSYYWDAEKKESINGIPVTTGDTKHYTKDNWKIFFLNRKIFLVNELNEVRKSFNNTSEVSKEESDEVVKEDIPTTDRNSDVKKFDEAFGKDEKKNEDEEEVKIEDVPF